MVPSERIDQLIAKLSDWRGATLAAIRKAFLATDAEIVEEWKWMGSPTWSHSGILAVGNAHKDKVKLTFAQGAHLADPDRLFNAGLDGNTWRAIDFAEGDKVNVRALKALVRAAIAHNQQKTKRKAPPKAPAVEKTAKEAREPKGAASARTAKGSSAPAKVKLLAGGNPQIAKGDGDAPVQAYIAAVPGWKQEVGRRIDAIVTRAVPHVRKAVKWNSPFYGVEGRGWFMSFHCMTKYIKVGFFRGASLDPVPPVASKQPDVRYVDLHEGELDEAQLAAWAKQAAALPGWKP